jgi:hypothetical protein
MRGKGNMKQLGDDAHSAREHEANLSVAEAYANQAAYCRANGSPSTARIVEAIAALVERGETGAFIETIRGWQGPVLGDAVPLRSAAALHGLWLSGNEPELVPIYSGEEADDLAIVAGAIRRHEGFLLPWLDGPPQTNEAGRSSNYVAALLWLAGEGLPPRFECLEIGASAGINLMIDRYGYDLGGVKTGPEDAAMHLAPEWRGPPPPDCPIAFESLRGCDVAPVDLADPRQALRLRAYAWQEHRVRFERLDAAIAAAKASPPDLVPMNAADFVEQELSKAQSAGTTRVLMHSIVWQYVPVDQQRRVTAAMEGYGSRATTDRPLAWIALEADRTVLAHALKIRMWPGRGEWALLAASHAHGAWIDWRAR